MTSGYRPTRSQQLAIAAEIRNRGLCEHDNIIVHHVLEDTPLKLVVQVESYAEVGRRDKVPTDLPYYNALCNPMSARNRPRFFRLTL